ncbi:MAG TPA: type II CAAX endopeptidase family protein [Bryobacteraceae bacterium]|nr:type II CAAX endopeptidase family protein [Bryobacteraceae bacterium]
MLPDETPVQSNCISGEGMPVAEPVAAIPPEIPISKSNRDPFWGYQDLALVLGLMVAATAIILLGVGVATFVWPRLKSDPMPLLLPTNLAMYFFLLVILKFVFSSRYGKPMLSSLGWRMTNGTMLGYAVLAGVALPFVISGIGNLLRTPKISTPMDQIPNSIPLALMAVTLAPFFEELFFRGLLQPLLTRTFGVVFGILLTAALFGSLHAVEYSFVWQYIVAIGLVGVALGFMRVWTNSIVPTTVMHACFNGLQLVALLYQKHQ